jgi:hypothetical protein
MKYFFLALVALLPLTACQRSEPKPSAGAALERPVVALAIKPGERVLIPRAAFVERAGVPGVFVLSEDGLARFRMLRPGKSVGERLEVLAGLRGDERLVLGDLREVRDGSPIRAR